MRIAFDSSAYGTNVVCPKTVRVAERRVAMPWRRRSWTLRHGDEGGGGVARLGQGATACGSDTTRAAINVICQDLTSPTHRRRQSHFGEYPFIPGHPWCFLVMTFRLETCHAAFSGHAGQKLFAVGDVTVLVFLAAATRTGFVASDVENLTLWCLHRFTLWYLV